MVVHLYETTRTHHSWTTWHFIY